MDDNYDILQDLDFKTLGLRIWILIVIYLRDLELKKLELQILNKIIRFYWI